MDAKLDGKSNSGLPLVDSPRTSAVKRVLAANWEPNIGRRFLSIVSSRPGVTACLADVSKDKGWFGWSGEGEEQ